MRRFTLAVLALACACGIRVTASAPLVVSPAPYDTPSPIACHDCYVAIATSSDGTVYAVARAVYDGADDDAIDATLALVPANVDGVSLVVRYLP